MFKLLVKWRAEFSSSKRIVEKMKLLRVWKTQFNIFSIGWWQYISSKFKITKSTLTFFYFVTYSRFYINRISIRMLINQHSELIVKSKNCHQSSLIYKFNFICLLALLFGQIPQPTKHIGCIEVDCNPRRVVVDAYENARFLCDQYCKLS